MIQFISMEEIMPKNGKYYLVKCPDFCESGFEVAKFDDGCWHNGFSDITCYVKWYYSNPLSEL